LVVHGPALTVALTGAPTAAALSDLLARGVIVAACENSMRSAGVTAEQLADGARIVPSGIAQLVRRQRDGWAYVRP